MRNEDFRKHSIETQRQLRITAVKATLKGSTQQQAADLVGVSRQIVSGWVKLYREGGEEALAGGQRGRQSGDGMRLTQKQSKQVQKWITDTTPEQLKFPFALWTRTSIQHLIANRLNIKLPLSTIGDYMKRWGFTAQRPKKQAYEQQPQEIKKWLDQEYPKVERRAKRQGAEIHWGDETGIRSDTNYGRSYAPKGKTPVIKKVTKRFSLNVISTITNQGKMRFMTFKGNFNTKIYLTFLKRLIKGAEKKIFLIVDNIPVHHAKRIEAWLNENKAWIEVIYLPRYAPEYNPDELLNNDLKQNCHKKRIPKTQKEFETNAHQYLSSLQRTPLKIKNFFQAPKVIYAA